MGGRLDPKTRLLCKQKIAQLEARLEEIEALKAEEGKIRRDLQAQREKLAQCPDDDEAEEELMEQLQEAEGDADEPVQDSEAAPPSSAGGQADVQKRLKALNKKLKQIAELKAKEGSLEPEAAAKVASEARLLREVAAIKAGKLDAGKVYDDAMDAEMQAEEASKVPLQLPADPAEREKRLKALSKKLQQIAELKKREDPLDPEARAKVASERHVKQEIAALERGDAEVMFTGPTEDELIEEAMNKKIEVEKKLKAVRKKLSQIDALKAKGDDLEPDARAKVDSEPGLKKELGALERELGALNREERERVARRLGYAEEVSPDAKQKPNKKK